MERFQELLRTNDLTEVARRIVDYDVSLAHVNHEQLREDAFKALDGHPGVDIELDDNIVSNCSVAGYLREDSQPPKIVVYPSGTYTRDTFTVLHEYGHYLQLAHLEWSDVLNMQPRQYQESLDERVADEIAAQILLGDVQLSYEEQHISARKLRDIYESHPSASRSAIAYRVISESDITNDVMVAVFGDWGRDIIFSRARGESMALGRHVEQPTIHRLVEDANINPDRVAFGTAADRFFAKSGRSQSGHKIELVLDEDGYGFVVARRATKFGIPEWNSPRSYSCNNPACDKIYSQESSQRRCGPCKEWACPECDTCGCEEASQTTCSLCYVVLTPGETSGIVEHECMW